MVIRLVNRLFWMFFGILLLFLLRIVLLVIRWLMLCMNSSEWLCRVSLELLVLVQMWFGFMVWVKVLLFLLIFLVRLFFIRFSQLWQIIILLLVLIVVIEFLQFMMVVRVVFISMFFMFVVLVWLIGLFGLIWILKCRLLCLSSIVCGLVVLFWKVRNWLVFFRLVLLLFFSVMISVLFFMLQEVVLIWELDFSGVVLLRKV